MFSPDSAHASRAEGWQTIVLNDAAFPVLRVAASLQNRPGGWGIGGLRRGRPGEEVFELHAACPLWWKPESWNASPTPHFPTLISEPKLGTFFEELHSYTWNIGLGWAGLGWAGLAGVGWDDAFDAQKWCPF